MEAGINKFIVLSDLHIHNYTKYDVEGSRLRNCLKVLEDVFVYANSYGISEIIFPGDLYDQQKSIPSIVINETIAMFSKLFVAYPNIEFIAISGNHDHASKNTLEYSAVTSLSHLKETFNNFHLIDNQTTNLCGGRASIEGIPYYTHKEHFKDVLDHSQSLITSDKRYLMIHQTPEHSNPMIPFDCKYEDFTAFDFVFCGHIHKYERLSKNFVIVGSPLHRDLGDEGQDKGFLVFDIDTNDYERVLLDFPKFRRQSQESIAKTGTTDDFLVPIIEQEDTKEVVIDLNSKHSDQLRQYANSLELSNDLTELGLSMLS